MDEASAKQFARVQIAMWVDGRNRCAVCGRVYESVDDFIERKVRAGNGFASKPSKPSDWKDAFVDDACFPQYEAGERYGVGSVVE